MDQYGVVHWRFNLKLFNVIYAHFNLDIFVLGMTLNCIHIFIVSGSFLYWCVMRLASQRFFIHNCIYLFIISYLATCRGTNGLSVLMCRKTVNQSINQSINLFYFIVSIIVFGKFEKHSTMKVCTCISFLYFFLV